MQWAFLVLVAGMLLAGLVRAWDHDGRHGYARPDGAARVTAMGVR